MTFGIPPNENDNTGAANSQNQIDANNSLSSIDNKLSGTLQVNVVNQLDLTTITTHLTDIKLSCLDIDANTDDVEQKLLDTIAAINSTGAVNHIDLLDIVYKLQAVDANTNDQENILTGILNKLIASPANFPEQQTQTASLQLIDDVVGSNSGGVAGTKSQLSGGVYRDSLPNLTDGQQVANQLDKKGRHLKPVNNGRVSYAASSTPIGLTPATNALKDFWRIRGSNTKTVYVKRITVSAYAGGRSVNSIGIQKRSTANIGGITTNFSVIPVDTLSPASNAVVDLYTTTPTTEGTLVATVASSRFLIPKNDDQVIVEKEFDFTETGNLVLRGANESLTLQCGQTIIASALFFITVEWDEE